jgi:capsid protein
MEMAREMTRNNPLVMQGVRRLVANVVGRGFVLDSDSGDKGIDDVNGYRWAEWSRSPEACDDQQELDFHGLEKLTLQHVIIDGDLCSLPNRDGGIESQEGHRLKTSRNTTKNVVHGVQQDERRRRLAYWFTKEDIEPWRSVTRVNDTTQINARDEAGHRQVFHHYLPDRRSQTRGVTAFAPMADTADHWDDLQFANLVAAKIQSCYTILREMDAGAPALPFAGGGDHSASPTWILPVRGSRNAARRIWRTWSTAPWRWFSPARPSNRSNCGSFAPPLRSWPMSTGNRSSRC